MLGRGSTEWPGASGITLKLGRVVDRANRRRPNTSPRPSRSSANAAPRRRSPCRMLPEVSRTPTSEPGPHRPSGRRYLGRPAHPGRDSDPASGFCPVGLEGRRLPRSASVVVKISANWSQETPRASGPSPRGNAASSFCPSVAAAGRRRRDIKSAVKRAMNIKPDSALKRSLIRRDQLVRKVKNGFTSNRYA